MKAIIPKGLGSEEVKTKHTTRYMETSKYTLEDGRVEQFDMFSNLMKTDYADRRSKVSQFYFELNLYQKTIPLHPKKSIFANIYAKVPQDSCEYIQRLTYGYYLKELRRPGSLLTLYDNTGDKIRTTFFKLKGSKKWYV